MADLQSFIAAQTLNGKRAGMVYKLGESGLGYYRDAPPVVELTPLPRPLLAVPPVAIQLEPLCCVGGKADSATSSPCDHRPGPAGKRPRRQRGRRRSCVDTVQLNGSMWSSLRTWMELHRRKCMVVLGQEHRLLPDACADVCSSMAADGWRIGFSPALRTEPAAEASGDEPTLCTSAGVLVGAPCHVGCEPLCPFPGWDQSPAGCTGRLAVAWIHIQGGVAVLSAYFWHSEGWSCRNQALTRQMVLIVQSIDCPWVLSADFNMEPDELQSHELYDELRGLLVRPATGTCISGASRKCYDYFIVDRRLLGYIESIEVLENFEDATTYPHFPVRMRLRAPAGGVLKRVQVRPRALPVECPIGCQRAPVQWPLLPASLDSEPQATALWQQLAEAAEVETLNRHDIVGAAAEEYQGRGDRTAWVLRPVLPGKLRNRPRGSKEARLWRWLGRRTTELWHLTASRMPPAGGILAIAERHGAEALALAAPIAPAAGQCAGAVGRSQDGVVRQASGDVRRELRQRRRARHALAMASGGRCARCRGGGS